MRIARKLALLAAMAIAATAIAAPSAFGQSIEVKDEETGQHCTAVSVNKHVVSGGCKVHTVSNGDVTLVSHVFGIESTDSVCKNEFTAHLNESGTGYLTNQSLTGVQQCSRRPCAETGNELLKREWPGSAKETVPGGGTLTITFCLWGLTNMSDTTCEVTIGWKETSTNHRYEFTANDAPCHGTSGFRGEITGHWLTESPHDSKQGTEAEVVHL